MTKQHRTGLRPSLSSARLWLLLAALATLPLQVGCEAMAYAAKDSYKQINDRYGSNLTRMATGADKIVAFCNYSGAPCRVQIYAPNLRVLSIDAGATSRLDLGSDGAAAFTVTWSDGRTQSGNCLGGKTVVIGHERYVINNS